LNFNIVINDKMVTIKIVRKRGMKNTYIRPKSSSLVQINSNQYFTQKDAKILIEKKIKWLEKSLLLFEKNSLEKDEFHFLGVKHKNLDSRDLNIFYKNEAIKIIPPIVENYSNLMSLYPSKIKFRKNKRTWGSCNYKNDLNFNFLLVKFPLEIIEYVVIHELAHIKHKNHSQRFWDLVEEYCSDYKKREKLFKSLL
jgi:predicted metal-dependent hydrolase